MQCFERERIRNSEFRIRNAEVPECHSFGLPYSSLRIREFIEIAYAGGGEAFLSADERQIMTQLLVLVFGSQHRSKVIEAFKLMEK